MNLVVNCLAKSLKFSIYPSESQVNHLSVDSPKLAGNILHMTALFEIQYAITY